MTNNVYATFQFYDQKGRRLSIFGIPFEGLDEEDNDVPTLEVQVYTCSKKDEFSKKRGRELFTEYNKESEDVHPDIFVVRVENEKPGQAFINFCKRMYYKKETKTVNATRDFLIGGRENRRIPIGNVKQTISKASFI